MPTSKINNVNSATMPRPTKRAHKSSENVVSAKAREHARQQNRNEAVELVKKVLRSSTKDKIFVNLRDFSAACGPGARRGVLFADVVSNILTDNDICQEFGVWIVTEYEADLHVMVRVFESTKMKTPEEIVETESPDYHFFKFQ